MKISGEWGDNITLQVAANLYEIDIVVISPGGISRTIAPQHEPKVKKYAIKLSFWVEEHYNSIHES